MKTSGPVTFIAKGDTKFEVTHEQAQLSVTAVKMMEDTKGSEVYVPDINPTIMKHVVNFLSLYSKFIAETDKKAEEKSAGKDKSAEEDPKKKFGWDVMKSMKQETLFAVIAAADYLDIKPLLQLLCQEVADQVKGKTPKEIMTHFGQTEPFTPAEEKSVLDENPWLKEA